MEKDAFRNFFGFSCRLQLSVSITLHLKHQASCILVYKYLQCYCSPLWGWTMDAAFVVVHVYSTSNCSKRVYSCVSGTGGGPRVVVSTAAFHARVRGSVPGLGGLKETKLFLPHPRVKVSIVGSLRDREVACSASDRQGANFESCVWRTVSSQSSYHPQEVLLAQFSLYLHKGGLKPDSFIFFVSGTMHDKQTTLPSKMGHIPAFTFTLWEHKLRVYYVHVRTTSD